MNDLSNFFKIDQTQIKPAAGRILISEPLSTDAHFGRSVVLLTEHNEKGSIGFVLNKLVKMPLSELINDIGDFTPLLSIGGPVSPNTMHFIHTLGKALPNAMQVQEGLFWGGDFGELRLLIKEGAITTDQVRFFLGYSGWAPGQLHAEIEKNYWLVSTISTQQAMTDPQIWETKLKSFGSKFKTWANVPHNPELN